MQQRATLARRGLAILAAALMGYPAMLDAQEAGPQFQLVVVRGANAQNNVKKGRATQAVVEVRDRNNKPVSGVAVVFLLPNQGPSGTFVGGGQTTTVTTNAQGQASASFTPNSAPGKFSVDVQANVQGQSVKTSIPQVNVAAAAVSATTVGLIVAAVAAAGVGLGVGLTRDNGNTGPNGVRIGAGNPSVGPPR
jgi:hypothetical protein